MNTYHITHAVPQWLITSKVYMVAIVDLEGNYVFVNDLFKEKFAFIAQDFIGLPIHTTIHKDDIIKCSMAGKYVLENPDQTMETRIRKPKNKKDEYYWSDWEFSAYKNPTGEIIGVLSVGHDISKLERLQRKTKIFKEKTDAIIDNITDGFFVLDTKWRFVKINRIAEKVFNAPPRTLLRKVIWDAIPSSENYQYAKELRKAVENRIATTFEEYDHITDTWYNVVAYPSERGITVFFKNITPEKKSQQGLKNSENKLKAILESTKNGIVLISPDVKILSFNQVANNITFTSFQKYLEEGKDFREYLFEGTHTDFFLHFNQALEGQTVSIERLFEVGNKKTWYNIYYFPVYAVNTKNIIGVAINSEDIDIKKQAQEALKNSENKLRAISESAVNSNILLTPEGNISSFNKVANEISLKLWNTPLLENKDFRLFLPKGAEFDFEYYFNKALAGETSIIERQRTIGTQNWWFEVYYFPVYEPENNQIMGVALSTIDVSVRKNAQQALVQSQYMLSALYDSTQDACIFLDTSLKIQYFNKMAENTAIFLFKKSCCVGDDIFDFVYHEYHEDFMIYFQQAKYGKTTQAEKHIFGMWWEFTISPVHEAGELVGIAMNIKDVSTRKMNEERILKQNEILKEIARKQSHSLRRPLTHVLGLIDAMAEDKKFDEKLFNYLKASAQEMDKVIHDIVHYIEKEE